MQIHLKTLGCRLNEAELESWAEQFQAKGHRVVQSPDHADLLVVNTCAVTREAVKKSRQIIRRTHKQNPTAKLVVSGCYATLSPDITADIDCVDLVVNNQQKDQLVDMTLNQLDIESMPAISAEPGEAAIFQRGRNRAFIKVQDGCRYRCSFCIVTVARGNEKSRTVESIISDINSIHRKGIQEVILTGVHLGGYGSDLNCNLTYLLKRILSETTVPRIRLGSLEPWELDDDFFELFSSKRLMPHLHLPLQSGSNSVLKRMARRCKTEDFSVLINNAKNQMPNLNITTDIIVGFPGETKEEWQASLSYIKKSGFSHIHIFTYSPREGTKAATLLNQVTSNVKKSRSRQLHSIAKEMRGEFLSEFKNTCHHVLWESRDEQGRWTGYTDNFIRVILNDQSENNLENHISLVELTDVNNNQGIMTGKLIH
ncbi:MAG: tRNA (N(6)-L-threonylcarbamoyladenosine(37)-C(2))-methylthiotransferase MtaB [Pseudomonadota bacterium]